MLVEPSAETYDRILRLRVVRSFTEAAVSEDDVRAILEAGRWTGSSKNRQGWRLAVITDEADRRHLAATGRFTEPMLGAPVAMALIRTPDGNDFDIGRLAQNLMLAAAALGLGSCPVTLHDEAEAARVLGLPDDHGCRWAVVIGHPDEAAERDGRAARPMRGRLPLDELVWR